MPTFDELLQRFLTDPETNIPGLRDPLVDNVAWHDFSHYELLQPPQFYQPPSSGGSGPSGGLDDPGWIPVECQDLCPGPDPQVLCVIMGAARQLDDPEIALPELEQFLSTVSRTVTSTLVRRLAIRPGSPVPEFATRAKQAYETAIIQGGMLSRMYETYVSIPVQFDRDAMFREAVWGYPGNDWCGLIDVVHRWRLIDPVPWSVFRDVGNLVSHVELSVANALGNARGPLGSQGTAPVLYSVQAGSTISALTSSPALFAYDFGVYAPDSTNLGLQLVYRQEWRLLGGQRGEVVRTLPLAPKESLKVSIKVTRRNKTTRTAESLKSVESTTEVTDTSKDSTEVVDETTKTNGWKVEAGGSVGFGGIGVEASGGINEEVSSKVGETNTFLNESVQKTANKIRTESKVVVSIEGESTFESTSSSEITNPNDEIAVTCVYSELQRQYEVFTHLNEVNTVIFVAEKMPLSEADLRKFIEDNDWIIAKVLLDDSFRDALSAINQDVRQDGISNELKTHFDTAMTRMMGNQGILQDFAQNTTSLSLRQADLTQEVQRSVQQVYKEREEKKRSGDLYDLKVKRLVEHVRRNILHYCRAVWSQEDPDQRMLRYQKLGITVPTQWQFVVGTGTIDLADILADPTLLLDGVFQPVPGSERPLEDVINPAGPIGYHGNYAVFYAEPDLRLRDANVFDVLDVLRSPYVDPADPSQLLDPAREYIENNAVAPPNPIPDDTKEEMLRLVPELRAAYESIEPDAVDALGVLERRNFFNNNGNFTPHWVEFLFRRQYTRQLVLDTNNLVMDLEVGTGSTLEGFKRLHRFVDVQKAIEERNKLQLENQRLQDRLTAAELSDPDIENMTVITGRVECCPPKAGSGDDGDDHDDHDD